MVRSSLRAWPRYGPEGHLVVKFLKKIFAPRGVATRPRPAPPRQSSASWPGSRRPEPPGRPYRPCFSHSNTAARPQSQTRNAKTRPELGPGGLATPEVCGCLRAPPQQYTTAAGVPGGRWGSVKPRSLRMARPSPTPCRVCSRLCVSNKFSHFRQKAKRSPMNRGPWRMELTLA